MKRLRVTGLLLGWCLLTGSGAWGAGFEAGMLLVAREKIRDPRFHETVVLVVQHDQRGTAGLIINRTSRLAFAELIPDRAGLPIAGTVSYGGPVAPGNIMVLVMAGEGEKPPEPALKVVGSLYVTGIEALASWLTAERAGTPCRVFLGHAGWAPGQLENEMKGDAWQLLPADEKMPFTDQLDALWQELRKLDRAPAAP